MTVKDKRQYSKTEDSTVRQNSVTMRQCDSMTCESVKCDSVRYEGMIQSTRINKDNSGETPGQRLTILAAGLDIILLNEDNNIKTIGRGLRRK